MTDRPKIEVTEEMVERACKAVYGKGGFTWEYHEHHHSPEDYKDSVREVLEVALGLREFVE